jgi:hypothetical protein
MELTQFLIHQLPLAVAVVELLEMMLFGTMVAVVVLVAVLLVVMLLLLAELETLRLLLPRKETMVEAMVAALLLVAVVELVLLELMAHQEPLVLVELVLLAP